MEQPQGIVVSGSTVSTVSMNLLVRQVRGSFFASIDPRFFWVALVSIVLHAGIIYYFNIIKIPIRETATIETVPERFARLIIEKPIPKVPLNVKKTVPAEREKIPPVSKPTPVPETKTPGEKPSKFTETQRTQARKAVAKRAARVEQRMRSVGVLGMLTGVGVTAKGPAIVDVLGAMGTRKESSTNLDEALEKMSGLRRTDNIDVLQKKLVKSKDVAVQHKEEIDDLIASVGSARSVDLAKRGEFIIQKPESIEGAASSNAKRDNSAINVVVASHKASIRMSYEKYLKRDPALAGKVTVRFTISASGSVTAVTIMENTTNNGELEQEIIRKVRMWRFETIPEGDVTVTYPFVFTPAS
jgi:TonB family protein